MRNRLIKFCVVLVTALGAQLLAPPVNAAGGENVMVRADGVWRAEVADMYDHAIPAACSGPTNQRLVVRMDVRATQSGVTVRNVRLWNQSARRLANSIEWSGRSYAVEPYSMNDTWLEGQRRTLSGSYYQAWSGSRAIHTISLKNSDGAGCNGVFQILFNKW